MLPISGGNTSAVQPSTTAEKALEASKVQKTEEVPSCPRRPVLDEYVPEEAQEPSGRYWISKGEDGQPKIYFDDPERAADAPEQPEAVPDAKELGTAAPRSKGPERKEDELYEGSTDKVDREIETLKKKRAELEQRLNTETDSVRSKELERQLAQVERELKQKDNDTYRRQHTQIKKLS